MGSAQDPSQAGRLRVPLIAVCIEVGPVTETGGYVVAVESAFRDTEIPGFGSTGGLPLLDVSEWRSFQCANRDKVEELVATPEFRRICAACERLLVVVLDGTTLAPGENPEPYNIAPTENEPDSWIKTVTFFVSPRPLFAEQPFDAGRPSSTLRLGLADLDERDLRIPFLVLHILRAAADLLQAGAPGYSKPCLFFSHAKRDGVPLARGAKMWLDRLPGFGGFYDTDDLDLDKDWRTQLSKAVSGSILVVFRTEVFDQRYWCRQEVLWADQYRRPLVCVDARWQLQHDSSLISFDASPAVRVPDGSILRVLLAALREAFRVAVFQRRVSLVARHFGSQAEAIPRAPSIVSLASALDALKSNDASAQFVVYPNPSVPNEVRDALAGLVENLGPDREVRVRSFDEWCVDII